MVDQQDPSTHATPEAGKATQVPQVEPFAFSGLGWLALGVAGIAGAIAFAVSGNSDKPRSTDGTQPIAGTVATIDAPRQTDSVEACNQDGRDCQPARGGLRLEAGRRLRTSAGARATLALQDGTVLHLERATSVTLGAKPGDSLKVDQGTVVVNMTESVPATLKLDAGSTRTSLQTAKCTISVTPERTQIEVIRGQVTLHDAQRIVGTLTAGETCTLSADRPPLFDRAKDLGDAIARTEPTDESTREEASTPGIGELRAKKPGEANERKNAVRLSRHRVNVRVVGAIAKTEIEEVFTNESNDVLEGIFRFPLPADAQIERLALEVDGQLVEGAFTERERAGAIWRGSIVNAAPQLKAQIRDEIIWVPGPWRDPALLEWQRGNRFELRIYPIPKKGSRKIVLSYTQVVPGTAGLRHYSYPLPLQSADANGIDDFSFELTLRGHNPGVKPTVRGYEGRTEAPTTDVSHFVLNERRFLPRGDLQLDYEIPNGDKHLVAWAHQPTSTNEGGYVAMLLRPKLPSSKQKQARDYAFVVDTSRSMFGESLKRASAVTTRMIRELSRDDRVLLLACDSDCRAWPAGLTPAGASASETAKRFLDGQTAEGASDVAGALEQALKGLGRGEDRAQQIVYVGDGTPTAGPTRPATITREVKSLFAGRNSRLTAVAVGTDSDLQTLRTLAAASRGLVVPYVPGTNVAKAAYAALSATFAPRLVDAKIELPEGLSAIAPEQLGTLAAGDEMLVTGRMLGSMARGDVVLRGRVDDEPFEQRYPVELRPVAGAANAFVPRLFAGARISDLERRGSNEDKTEAVELSRKFSVASRYTSLLVLESQAMFDAFGLDNRRRAEQWTGELEDSQTTADAEGEKDGAGADEGAGEPVVAATARSGGLNLSGGGVSGPGRSSKAEAAPASAPMKGVAEAATRGDLSPSVSAPSAKRARSEDRALEMDELPQPRPRPRMIPMRRVWERKGELLVGKTVPSTATYEKIAKAERDLDEKPDQRNATKQLFDLYFKGGEFEKATQLADRWSQRDPLDVEALIARADLAARRGDRPLAIRILGSVVDVRPSDHGAQQRLARLHRWQGNQASACRFSLALAEFRPSDEKALADALLCLESTNRNDLALELRSFVTERVLRAAEILRVKALPTDTLSGDLRLTASWSGSRDVDIDLALIDPDAHRVSWLGAPTRSVITATNVLSDREEGLALRGAKPGEYLLELTRGAGQGTVQGTLTVNVAGTTRQIPFTLDGERVTLGIAKIAMVSRLVPVERLPMNW